MAAPNFATLLDVDMQDVKAPPTFPAGPWHWRVIGQPRRDVSSKKQTPFVEFTMKPLAAMDGVDEEALTDFGDFKDKTLPATFYLTEKSLFMLKEFLSACGLSGKMDAAIEETMNAEVIGFIRHEASEDGTRVFARFGKFAPVE